MIIRVLDEERASTCDILLTKLIQYRMWFKWLLEC